MAPIAPLQLVWNWPLWFLTFLVYLSFVVVGGSIVFFLYTVAKELREGTAW